MGVKIISKNKNSVIKFLNKLKLFAHGYSWVDLKVLLYIKTNWHWEQELHKAE